MPVASVSGYIRHYDCITGRRVGQATLEEHEQDLSKSLSSRLRSLGCIVSPLYLSTTYKCKMLVKKKSLTYQKYGAVVVKKKS